MNIVKDCSQILHIFPQIRLHIVLPVKITNMPKKKIYNFNNVLS